MVGTKEGWRVLEVPRCGSSRVPLGGKEVLVPVNVVFDGRGKGAVLVDTVGSETLSDVVKEVGMMIVIFTSVNVLL